MAITAATTLSEFSGYLNPAQAAPIFDEAARQSVVQSLVQRIPLGASGQSIPVVTAKPVAGWVTEGTKKPTTKGTLGLKSMTPEKLAAIVVVSKEVVRANPGDYVTRIRGQLAEAFAVAFDSAALHGTNTPFDNYIDETAHSVAFGTTAQADGSVYGDIVAGLSVLVNDGKRLTGFAFDSIAEPILLSGTDTSGRPLFVETPLEDTTSAVTPGRLIGRRSVIGDGVADGDIVGYGGDWRQAAWGVIRGIEYSVSTEASVTINNELLSLFEHNLVAILAEAEYGWVVNDVDAFVQYTGDESSS